jgi:hypothetical protein
MNQVLIDILAFIGLMTCVYWVVKAIKALTSKKRDEDAPALPAAAAEAGPSSGELAAIAAAVHATVGPHQIVQVTPAQDDIAVIAAAVFAMLDSYRVVRIEDNNRGVIWTAEGRWAHQISHSTR